MHRVPDDYFNDMYAQSRDPWQLACRWYEQRKYAMTMAMLPLPRYRHAYEPGCSIGVLTELLSTRCDRVTATDVAAPALEATAERLTRACRFERVTLEQRSLDSSWPTGDFDLVVLSEVAYYLDAASLRDVLDRECPRLAAGATLIAAHWRHPVDDYPMTGDEANFVIAATAELQAVAHYSDDDVVIDVFANGEARSVAAQTGVPGVFPS
ncbi:methyltransferase [Mycolicibacterium sp. P9-64]|uniref:SAM-dependent methyltransferase n=1 Tax=Mycolicibacterium sp. P9-64 TaxID=2024612 RepID=UPI0011EF66D5|nr:SAM-dependent methyltransferase [Mycolicibacterium sp. P9-64]KAA0080469.1 methyltransferase [Mycolicibacterium sp. P9-64]